MFAWSDHEAADADIAENPTTVPHARRVVSVPATNLVRLFRRGLISGMFSLVCIPPVRGATCLAAIGVPQG